MLADEGERLVELAPPGCNTLAGAGIDQVNENRGKVVRACSIAAIASSRS